MKPTRVLAGAHLGFYECWSDWMPWNIGRMNWRNFTLAHVDLEWTTADAITFSVEFTFVLLGVGFTLSWYRPEDVRRLVTMAEGAASEPNPMSETNERERVVADLTDKGWVAFVEGHQPYGTGKTEVEALRDLASALVFFYAIDDAWQTPEQQTETRP